MTPHGIATSITLTSRVVQEYGHSIELLPPGSFPMSETYATWCIACGGRATVRGPLPWSLEVETVPRWDELAIALEPLLLEPCTRQGPDLVPMYLSLKTPPLDPAL